MNSPHHAALAEMTSLALTTCDPAALMLRAVTLAAGTLDVEYSEILELVDGTALVMRACIGWNADTSRPGCIATAEEALITYTLQSQAPVTVEDWLEETLFSPPTRIQDHAVISSLRVVINGSVQPLGILGVDSRAQRRFSAEDINFLQTIANVLALAIERDRMNQMLKQQAAEQNRELARREQVAESLHQILTVLNSSHSMDDVLDRIVAQACRLLGASACALYRLQSHEGSLNIRASRGLGTHAAALNLPIDCIATRQAVQMCRPVVVSNTARNSFDGASAVLPDSPPHLQRLTDRYRALLAVPLIVNAEVYGAITLFHDEPRVFSAEEVQQATTLSEHAALAIENARLVAAARGRGILEERQRLARDLHDSVTQALYSVTLHAEAASRLLPLGEVDTVARYLREVHDTAQEGLDEMRLLIFELRPPILDHDGLVAALQARLDAVEGRTHVQTTFIVENMSRLPSSVEHALYRTAQEALNNVLKHAHAHNLRVVLRHEPPIISLEVADDGVGCDIVVAREKGGLGLRGIEERVAQLGGQFFLNSEPGIGTRVRVEVPM